MATHEHGPIEVDPAVLENEESGYDSSGINTSTTSLSSAAHEYIFENGRRYHAYFGTGKNPLPTDEVEQDRLDMHHETMLLLMKGALLKAPIDRPQRILDIGTGTGIWAIDAADKYPMADVTGTDLSPIQPGWVPANCHFEVDDAELDWTYPRDYFDFIHVRNLAQSIDNWPKLMSEIYNHTKPEGYVELAELGSLACCDDGSMKDDNGVKQHIELQTKAFTSTGRPPATAESLRGRLKEAGFVDVQVFNFKHPLGPWPKESRLKHIGALNLLNAKTGFHAYGMQIFTRTLGMPKEEAEKLCTAAYESIRDKRNHVYTLFHVAYGRKP